MDQDQAACRYVGSFGSYGGGPVAPHHCALVTCSSTSPGKLEPEQPLHQRKCCPLQQSENTSGRVVAGRHKPLPCLRNSHAVDGLGAPINVSNQRVRIHRGHDHDNPARPERAETEPQQGWEGEPEGYTDGAKGWTLLASMAISTDTHRFPMPLSTAARARTIPPSLPPPY